MAFYTFGPEESQLWAQQGLKPGRGTSNNDAVLTVINQDEEFGWNFLWWFVKDENPKVETYGWVRPVNNREVYISRTVAFAHYNGCGHNVFFRYYAGFHAPSRCPIHVACGSYLDEDSINNPN